MFKRNSIPLWIGIILMSGFFLMGQGWEATQLESGIIVMWAGTLTNIPPGYALCDGTNGTPDLSDRFIVGAGNSFALHETGGASEHDHDSGTFYAGTHTHSFSGTTAMELGTGVLVQPGSVPADSVMRHTHFFSGNTNQSGATVDGTSGLAESAPLFYALAYIMKL
jgi:hypothetical protein